MSAEGAAQNYQDYIGRADPSGLDSDRSPKPRTDNSMTCLLKYSDQFLISKDNRVAPHAAGFLTLCDESQGSRLFSDQNGERRHLQFFT